MSNFRQSLKRTIEVTRIHGAASYSWFGKRTQTLPLRLRQELPRGVARDCLIHSLQARLYSDFYCRGIAILDQHEAQLSAVATGVGTFTAGLSEANNGQGYWDVGWTIINIDEDVVEVSKKDLTFLVNINRVRPYRGQEIALGVELALRFPKEFTGISPGFYTATGNLDFSQKDSQSLMRLYWNLQLEGAKSLVALTTTHLNNASLPFKLKVINNPNLFHRCDAAVLYARRQDYPVVLDIVCKIHLQIVAHLGPKTPAFTKTVAKGLGFAEDPPGTDSFGQNRCRILAEGIVRAYERGDKKIHDRMETVENCFTENGIDLDRPYLNSGSVDEFQAAHRLVSVSSSNRENFFPFHTDQDPFLQTALDIGLELSNRALWHTDRCNFLGIEATTLDPTASQGAMYKMLGPNIYSGTSGVALFLAELSSRTANAKIRRTALGAIEQALQFVEGADNFQPMGLYVGWLGIALSAARVGHVLREDSLIQRAARLLDQYKPAENLDDEFDLMSGNSGAIIALIILRDLLNDPSLLNLAERLGMNLIQNSEKSGRGSSWRSPNFKNARNLTGLSHGTAGVAFALMELFAVTRNPGYRSGAEDAFEYERSWFNARTQNWPDLRDSRAGDRSSVQAQFEATYWCHGAPGIGLSRLRAYEITRDDILRSDSIAALQTTQRWIESCLEGDFGNFSLCHGLAGNAEVLKYGHQVLGTEYRHLDDIALRVAEYGIRVYRDSARRWPCGTAGETPDLMVGMAGIGYFYLRCCEYPPPSLLLFRREEQLSAGF